jgi:hypothetical protein
MEALQRSGGSIAPLVYYALSETIVRQFAQNYFRFLLHLVVVLAEIVGLTRFECEVNSR